MRFCINRSLTVAARKDDLDRGAQQDVEPLNGMLRALDDGHHQPPEAGSGSFGKMSAPGTKKAAETSGYAADGNHAVVLPDQFVGHQHDRLETPRFLGHIPHLTQNRSV